MTKNRLCVCALNLAHVVIVKPFFFFFLGSQVMESEEFLLLPVNQLVDIISSDELNVRSEEQVFSAVMSWVKYNVTERRQNLGQVCLVTTHFCFPQT